MIYNYTRIIECNINLNEGNRYISNCFNSSRLNVLNEANIKDIGKTIIEAIKKAFKWIWDKLKQFGMFIKKKFSNIFNKIELNIDKINLQIKQLKNIMVLDLEKLNDNLLEINVEEDNDRIFGKKIKFNECILITKDIESAKEQIKSIFEYYCHNNSDLNDIEYKNYLYGIKNVLNPLYEKIKHYKNDMKKINDDNFNGSLNIDNDIDINDISAAIKRKFSIYEEDGSIKKEYQKKVTIKSTIEVITYMKVIKNFIEKYKKVTMDYCEKNSKNAYQVITKYQECANKVGKDINEILAVLEQVDPELAAEFANHGKIVIEELSKKAVETGKVKTIIDKTIIENAEKTVSELQKCKNRIEGSQNNDKKDLNENYLNKFNIYNTFSEIKFI